MANRWKPDLTERDVTPESVYLNRRALLSGVAGLGLIGLAGLLFGDQALRGGLGRLLS